MTAITHSRTYVAVFLRAVELSQVGCGEVADLCFLRREGASLQLDCHLVLVFFLFFFVIYLRASAADERRRLFLS